VAVKSPCLRHKIRGLSPNVSRRVEIRKQRKVRRRKGAKRGGRYVGSLEVDKQSVVYLMNIQAAHCIFTQCSG
jgi:hypothetical protein